MNPVLSNIAEEGDIYKFTISDINVSFANAIRRTILSDIPTVVIHTEIHTENQCTITTNTGRLHNEILKQRLSCIPIHIKELDLLPEKYILELDATNDTDNIMYVTTEIFRIRNKANGNYLTKEETRAIFPPNKKTGSFIDFARLRPKISDTIPGEKLNLTAEFSISTAKTNSMFNVVSKCAYGNTPDLPKITQNWEEQSSKLAAEGLSKEEIEFNKRNYYMLDAQRQFTENSFDFVIQTVGVFDNKELVQKACAVLQNKFIDMIQALDSEIVPILNSETTMDNCYDIMLENEDYTIGKVLEYILYEKFYVKEKTLSFCGFKKFHPHHTESTIRLAFANKSEKNMVKQYLREACVDAQDLFQRVYKKF